MASATPIADSGRATPALTAADVRVIAGGSNVASVSFYRDKNSNGVLEIGTDTLLGTDTNGSNGWSLSLTVSIPKNVQQQTFTYFAQAKDSSNVAGNVVSTTNTIKKGRVAAMVVTRDTRATSIDAVIASHYNDDHDSRHDLLEEIAATRGLLHRLRGVRRR